MTSPAPIVSHIVKFQTSLINIDLIKELWMNPERLVVIPDDSTGEENVFTTTTEQQIYEGKLVVHGAWFYAVTSVKEKTGDDYVLIAEQTAIPYDASESTPLCKPEDPFLLGPGDIDNYQDGGPLDTTIGIFICNYLFLAFPFGNQIPYLNETFSTSKLEKRIAAAWLENKITTDQVKNRYINTLSLFGHATEIIAPNISEKTITVPPYIHELLAKLVKDNKEALEAGDASVMSDIEKRVIDAYKKYLEGDRSLRFLLKPKLFNVTLKKLFLTQGMTEIFGQPGKFTFIANAMGNGWDINDLPTIFNEVRSGSYSRAVETADGGVIAKLILRVLQDTRITEDDCGTDRGGVVWATKDILNDFRWNYILNPDKSQTLITEDNAADLIGKKLTIRTPGYCQATQGFCAACFGKMFEVLGQKAFAPVANDFARTITTSALKKMHGSSTSLVDVSDISRYTTG